MKYWWLQCWKASRKCEDCQYFIMIMTINTLLKITSIYWGDSLLQTTQDDSLLQTTWGDSLLQTTRDDSLLQTTQGDSLLQTTWSDFLLQATRGDSRMR